MKGRKERIYPQATNAFYGIRGNKKKIKYLIEF